MICQAQIIVAAKIDDGLAIANQVDTLRGFDDAPGTIQAMLSQVSQFGGQIKQNL
jgi:hypothetical protein